MEAAGKDNISSVILCRSVDTRPGKHRPQQATP
jgi:hypothetical protein